MARFQFLNSAKTQLFLASILTCFTAAACAQVTPVATGLNNPRGLTFGDDGSLYVGEAGLGAGNGFGGVGMGLGRTGSVGRITNLKSSSPTFERVVTGLASVADENGVVGPDGVSLHAGGQLHILVAESTIGETLAYPNASTHLTEQFGRLLKVNRYGSISTKAQVGDFDYNWTNANKNAPFAPAGQFPDANPYAVLSLPGHVYIADAGSNTINEVAPNGAIRIIAFVPNPKVQLGPNLVTISDSVPTCVAKGPDGYLYVGTLTFGAFFASHSPQSKIYRINPTLSNVVLSPDSVWASGFNPITGCGFSKGSFYATEFFTLASNTKTGDVVKVTVNPDGSAGARTAMGVGALVAPNGFAADSDGSIYVSNFSVLPGKNMGPTGQVVRVDY